MDELGRVFLRANQILDLPMTHEDAAFRKLAKQESADFVSAVAEKVATARGAEQLCCVPAWRDRWVREHESK